MEIEIEKPLLDIYFVSLMHFYQEKFYCIICFEEGLVFGDAIVTGPPPTCLISLK